MEKENSVTVTENAKATAANLPTVAANREYKSTMFSMIFRNKKELLELYNAVNHSNYTDLEALQIVTLENAIYMNMKNDLAFVIDMRFRHPDLSYFITDGRSVPLKKC